MHSGDVDAGPSHSTSLVTDILSVPANMDTSLSAPPGDPTFTLTPKHPAGKSRLNPFKTLDKPPLAPKPLVTDEPLTSFGMGSPGGLSKTSHALTNNRGGKSGSRDLAAEASTSPSSAHQAAAASSAQTSGQRSSSQSHSPTSARSHLTEDLAAALQQEEERRASHAQAGSSSSSPAKPRRNGFLSKLVGSGNGGQQQPASTPFQLASQQFLEEQGPAGPDQEPTTDGTKPHGSSHAGGVQSAGPVLSTDDDQQAKQAQHGRQRDEHIGGSPSEVADRLISSLQGPG